MKGLIITGDDFGASMAVNEAIERAHRDGVLGTASLMVAGAAAADAIARARRLPALRVGLHVVLVCGRPMLRAAQIPALVNDDGEFSAALVRAGLRWFFRPAVRRQVEAEIRAQFAAFRATGLALDHVNAHNHVHLHPTVAGAIVDIGRDYGLRAVRVPYEPPLPSWRGAGHGLLRRLLVSAGLRPWTLLLQRRLRAAGLAGNDFAFGMHDTGGMTTELVAGLVRHLPEGVSEIYFHPATGVAPDCAPFPPGYAPEAELATLLSAELRAAIAREGIERLSFSDLALRPGVSGGTRC